MKRTFEKTKLGLYIVVGLLLFSTVSEAKKFSNFYDYLTAPEFDCNITSKRVFKPGATGGTTNVDGAEAACIFTYTCQPLKSDTKLKAFTANETCLASNEGVCEEAIDCARREKDKAGAKGKTSFGSKILDVSSVAKAANNKFNDVCWETNGIKDRRGTLQLQNQGKVLEEACVSTYVCKNKPAPNTTVCAITSENVLAGGKPTSKSVCPQLNDCINTDLTLPGFTDHEMKKMSAAERDRVMQQYESGVEKTVSSATQVSSTKPHLGGNPSVAATHGRAETARPVLPLSR